MLLSGVTLCFFSISKFHSQLIIYEITGRKLNSKCWGHCYWLYCQLEKQEIIIIECIVKYFTALKFLKQAHVASTNHVKMVEIALI